MKTAIIKKGMILNGAKNNIRKGENGIKEIEKFFAKTDKIMYGKTHLQKQESAHKSANLSDQILNLIRPVCKKVAKAIHLISHTNDQDLPKPKIP